MNGTNSFGLKGMRGWGLGLSSLALFQMSLGSALAASAPNPTTITTTSPIKHVIVIIGENHSFDNVFATYVPKTGNTIWNLLSEGIVTKTGTPGANFSLAQQQAALDNASAAFLLSPEKLAFSGGVLPVPLTGGPKTSYISGNTLKVAQESENGLPASYYPYLLTGGTGQSSHVPDTRIKNVTALPPGPFQLTNGSTFTYDSYSASPVHRFFQMWQELDCSMSHATTTRPSGCDAALFSWVETTIGMGSNGELQPTNFSTEYSASAKTTGEGSSSLGFYNMTSGDVPYFKSLADSYAISDNFHQSVIGGTGVNHIMLGHGDAIWFSDGAGNPLTPPENVQVASGTVNAGIVNEIENPNAAAGTNNWYTEDGYGVGSKGSSSSGGGSYANCADTTQPGVAPIVSYLQSLPKSIASNCQAGHYYLVNNYNPGYFGNGNNAYTDTNANNTVFTIPPSTVPSIGDSMIAANVPWIYYGDQWNNYVNDPYQLNFSASGANTDEYCNICNPFQYDTSIMANATVRAAHIQDTANLYTAITAGTLPSVSFVKPSGLVDGHPASSKLELFEGFAQKIVTAVKANSTLWADTAIFIVFDEGGGYYDSGYVQPVDFFGDGGRVPFIVVSSLAKTGYVSHDYSDHVSILKFIERNWGLKPISTRSRDNFPDPVVATSNPYVPTNSPAIGDLFGLFNF